MKILVTGFQPFGGESVNPAYEAVRRLPAQIAGADIASAEIPVVYKKGPAAVEAAIDAEKPDMVLCVGQAGGRAQITPEFVGINYANFRIPDNEGFQPLATKLEEDGPDAYFATIPVQAMADAAQQAGIPAGVSYTAGTYCCNEVLYSLLYALDHRHPGVRGGFVHVPYLDSQAANLKAGTPSMSLERIIEGLTLMIAAMVEHEGEDIVSASAGCEH